MKLFLIIAAVVLVVASLYADYKWRYWIGSRKSQSHEPVAEDPARRPGRGGQSS